MKGLSNRLFLLAILVVEVFIVGLQGFYAISLELYRIFQLQAVCLPVSVLLHVCHCFQVKLWHYTLTLPSFGLCIGDLDIQSKMFSRFNFFHKANDAQIFNSVAFRLYLSLPKPLNLKLGYLKGSL